MGRRISAKKLTPKRAEEEYNKARSKVVDLSLYKRAKLTKKEGELIYDIILKAYRMGFADANKLLCEERSSEVKDE